MGLVVVIGLVVVVVGVVGGCWYVAGGCWCGWWRVMVARVMKFPAKI